MKFLIQFLALAGLLAAGPAAFAAPRAAEEPSAVVISTNESAPVVKRSAPQKAGKATNRNKEAGKKARPANGKKAGKTGKR